ncbi:hypothetical protein H0H81_011486 [Sphagnurus paluster]|uniref:Ricin B lectin domain-containing protein n=1 Tax=Sphagnurus paluster TaxID=117069 RepID=A0A9P7GIG7_9AGAR|nr:hypothetical protein H0H81_011486 [Sphagnurus paluster]
MRSLSLSFVALALSVPSALARLYNITNNCGQEIDLYINEQHHGSIAAGEFTLHTYGQDWNGYIYTDANGGDGATEARTTRAGFFGKYGYYYIVIDTSRLNTGISIQPSAPAVRHSTLPDIRLLNFINAKQDNGFCVYHMGDFGATNGLYQNPPNTTAFPVPSSTPPQSPLFECPGEDIGYKVTFCPSGGFPPTLDDEPVAIHPDGDSTKCLDGGNATAGTPVEINECNGSAGQQWGVTAGTTSLSVYNTIFCVDAGTNPASGVGLTMERCSAYIDASQRWTYTYEKRFELVGSA